MSIAKKYVGAQLAGRYLVIAKVGDGGMAEVYLTVARGTLGDYHKLVVVKMMKRGLTAEEDFVPMFLDEARLTARLNHPNVVQTHDVGEDDGRYYITMEYLEGASYERIRNHTRGWEQFTQRMRLRMLTRVLRGLHYAHELTDYDATPLRVVHRDVTPSNVFVTYDGQVKLLDFGIAKARDSSTHTRTGLFKGKVGYIAPEQMFGDKVDRRADIYSVGVMLWEMLTGVPLWKELGQSEIFKRILAGQILPPSAVAKDVAPELEIACLRALSHDPADRYPTAAAFEREIEAYLAATSPSCAEAELGAGVGALFAGQRATMHATIETQLAQLPSSQSSVRAGRAAESLPMLLAEDPHRGPVSSRSAVALPRPGAADGPNAATPVGVAVQTPRRLLARGGPWLAAASVVALLGTIGARYASSSDGASAASHAAPGATAALSAAAAVASTAPRASVRGVTDTEVVLGMSAAFSGPAREYGIRMKLGVETALAAQNAHDGVAGRKLTLVALDDGYDSKRVGESMRQLVEDRGVFAFVGNTGTATSAIAAPYAVARKSVFFAPFSGSNVLRRDPPDRYVFNYRPSYEEETGRMVRYLMDVKKVPADGIVVFAQKDAFGDAGFEGAARALRRYGRSDSQLFRVGYERNSLDVDAAVADIARHNAEVAPGPNDTYRLRHPVSAVLVVAVSKPAAKFIQKLAARDLHPLLLATSASVGVNEELKEAGGLGAGRGMVMTQIVPHFDSGGSGVIRYREALSTFFPGEHPDPVSLEGYVAATLFAEGLKRAGRDLDGEKLVEAFEGLHDLDLQIGSILSFGPSEHQASHKVWGTAMDEDGNFKPLDLE
jgi:branched-chain amino acid transport system substrate-binding protein